MLLKEEFAANMSYLAPSINSMILAGEDLMTNKPLQDVLYMVLIAGNFLNSVSGFCYRRLIYIVTQDFLSFSSESTRRCSTKDKSMTKNVRSA